MPKYIRAVYVPAANYAENFTIDLPRGAEIFNIGPYGRDFTPALYLLVEHGTKELETRTFRAAYLSSEIGDLTGEAVLLPDVTYRYIGDMDNRLMLFEVLE